MEHAVRVLWGPHLVFGLPGLALVVALLARRRRGPGGPTDPAAARRLVAWLVGLGGAGAVAHAVWLAGPGVLVWYWAATALFLPLVARLRAVGSAPPRLADDTSRRGSPWALGAALLVAVPAAAANLGALHTAATHLPAWSAVFLAGVLLFACAFADARAFFLRAAPVAAGLFAALVVVTLLAAPGTVGQTLAHALREAWAYRPAGAGLYASAVTVAMAAAVPPAVAAAFVPAAAGHLDRVRGATLRTAAAALGFGTILGLAVAAGPPASSPAERALLPLERPHSRGLRPNPEVGQTVVLPEDTPLRPGHTYAMVLRADPRGHRFFQARLVAERNMIVAPAYQVLDRTDTVVFRPKPKFQARNPGWDVRVPVERTEQQVRGRRFYVFRPADPAIDLARLVRRRSLDDTPYLVADDFHFLGRVARAVAPDELGEHLAMYEVRPTSAPENPAFHEFFRMGYRGPYADDGAPRPPWAIVGREGFDAPLGTRWTLEFRSPPRGANILGFTRTGNLEAPPFRFLLGADTVVLRHRDGPAHDVYVPVRGAMEEGRLVFRATVDEWRDFRVVDRMEALSGPYLVTPPYRFDVEVRKGIRFPGHLEDRRALVPIDPRGEPQGPAPPLPYDPHPGALFTTDLVGPFLAGGDSLGIAGARLREVLGLAGALVALACVALLFAATPAAVLPASREGATALWLLAAGAGTLAAIVEPLRAVLAAWQAAVAATAVLLLGLTIRRLRAAKR